MRFGSIVRALVITSLASTSVHAQDTRPFQDSWFWGAKVGTLSLATSETSRTWAPTVGAEWFITRTAGGLWAFIDHTSFDVRSSVDDASTATASREVDVRNLRRIGFAAFVSPRAFGRVRPYAGLGLSLNVIGRAVARADTSTVPAGTAVETTIDEQRSRAAVIGLGGAQMRLARAALFTQFTVTPGNRRFLLNDGPMVGVELGVRYNFGTSIAR